MPVIYEKKCSCCKNLVIYEKGKKPSLCPFCEAEYWNKPKDERNLFILQDVYLNNGKKEEDLKKIFLSVLKYSKNIIKNSVKNKKFLESYDLEEKAEDITTIFIESYLKKTDFKVEHSFGGFLIRISKGVLYGNKQEDQTFSIDRIMSDNLSIATNPLFFIKDPSIQEKYKDNVYDSYLKSHEADLVRELYNLIEEIYKRISKKEKFGNRLLYLLGLKNFLSINKNSFMFEFYSLSGNSIKQDIENTKLMMRRYLIENQKDCSE